MLKQLQNNERPYCFFSEEEKEYLDTVPTKFIKILSYNLGDKVEWFEIWKIDYKNLSIYRIVEDYCPESEIIECETIKEDGKLWFCQPDFRDRIGIRKAVDCIKFIGYKYADGCIEEWPRRIGTNKPAEIPTHILFSK